MSSVEHRARRLLRWYPQSWRVRYGDEFTALLMDEFEECPGTTRRSLNVMVSGLVARCDEVGLAGAPRDLREQAQSSVAWAVGAAAVFAAFACAVLAQLGVDWQWERPYTRGEQVASVVMSVGAEILIVTAVVAFVPLWWTFVRRRELIRGRGLAVPACTFGAALSVLVVGGLRVASSWPGTNGRRSAELWLVPRSVARLMWSETMSITSVWAHPAWLESLATTEVIWMLVSPIAAVVAVSSVVLVVRRMPIPDTLLRFELAAAHAAVGAMGLLVIGGLSWFVDGGSGPMNKPATLFHLGLIDQLASLAMMTALASSVYVVRRARGWHSKAAR